MPESVHKKIIKYFETIDVNKRLALDTKYNLASIIVNAPHFDFIKTGPNQAHTTIVAERTVDLFFPIRCVDYIFAPPDAVLELQDVVNEWKLNIKVKPYPVQQ